MAFCHMLPYNIEVEKCLANKLLHSLQGKCELGVNTIGRGSPTVQVWQRWKGKLNFLPTASLNFIGFFLLSAGGGAAAFFAAAAAAAASISALASALPAALAAAFSSAAFFSAASLAALAAASAWASALPAALA